MSSNKVFSVTAIVETEEKGKKETNFIFENEAMLVLAENERDAENQFRMDNAEDLRDLEGKVKVLVSPFLATDC